MLNKDTLALYLVTYTMRNLYYTNDLSVCLNFKCLFEVRSYHTYIYIYLKGTTYMNYIYKLCKYVLGIMYYLPTYCYLLSGHLISTCKITHPS